MATTGGGNAWAALDDGNWGNAAADDDWQKVGENTVNARKKKLAEKAYIPTNARGGNGAAAKKLTRKEKKRLKPTQRQRKEAKLKQRAHEDKLRAQQQLERDKVLEARAEKERARKRNKKRDIAKKKAAAKQAALEDHERLAAKRELEYRKWHGTDAADGAGTDGGGAGAQPSPRGAGATGGLSVSADAAASADDARAEKSGDCLRCLWTLLQLLVALAIGFYIAFFHLKPEDGGDSGGGDVTEDGGVFGGGPDEL